MWTLPGLFYFNCCYLVVTNERILIYILHYSLYPWVCKYGMYPLGHPEIYYNDNIPDQVLGFLKCKILPPTNLFHPLLPVRLNGKLVFPLCMTCAEEGTSKENIQQECTHSDEQRALIGTWVSLEIDKALSLGYTIMEKYSAWHWPEFSQYDPETREGGVFSELIDLYLKEKQHASG